MLLLESGHDELERSVALVNRLARRCDGETLDAASLPLTDVEALLLELRRMLLGDVLLARAECPARGCGVRTDITFSIHEYLAHNRPSMPRSRPERKESGWFGLPGSDVEFRLVTPADLMAVMETPNPNSALVRRTIRPEGASGREVSRVQRMMESLSPSLSQEVQGKCPECGEVVRLFFSVRSYVQRELGFEAVFLYQDVHLLATRYHWSEEKILSLPRARRLQYAELALAAGGTN
jgi:hypothetical protein